MGTTLDRSWDILFGNNLTWKRHRISYANIALGLKCFISSFVWCLSVCKWEIIFTWFVEDFIDSFIKVKGEAGLFECFNCFYTNNIVSSGNLLLQYKKIKSWMFFLFKRFICEQSSKVGERIIFYFLILVFVIRTQCCS